MKLGPDQEHRGEPLLFTIIALGSITFISVTLHTGHNRLYVPSEGRSNNVKCLASGHKCHHQDLDPHSADSNLDGNIFTGAG